MAWHSKFTIFSLFNHSLLTTMMCYFIQSEWGDDVVRAQSIWITTMSLIKNGNVSGSQMWMLSVFLTLLWWWIEYFLVVWVGGKIKQDIWKHFFELSYSTKYFMKSLLSGFLVNLLRSMETLASRAAFVCGLLLMCWVSPGGLSERCGLSMWSEVGSSLMPLSLGDGDQSGEPDTESLPLRRAVRKSLSACSDGGSICWVTTLNAIISLSVWHENMSREGTVFQQRRPTKYPKDGLYTSWNVNWYL